MGQKEDIAKTENKIIVIRDKQVILDRDVAELYGVETRRINEALKNNPDKFPDGYVIELTNSEKEYVVENFDHLKNMKYSHATTKAFTEKGLYMLATILKSPLATEVTIAIIETFSKVREVSRAIAKVNDDAEKGIMPKEEEQGKIQNLMGEVLADNLPCIDSTTHRNAATICFSERWQQSTSIRYSGLQVLPGTALAVKTLLADRPFSLNRTLPS